MIYVKISLNTGGTYIQPIEELNILLEEIKEACTAWGNLSEVWTISLVEMTPEEYEQLPEFSGH